MLVYNESRPGLDRDGNEVTVTIELVITEQGAIDYQRNRNAMNGWRWVENVLSDEQLLEDFRLTNGAYSIP